jgi:hypothetical protein
VPPSTTAEYLSGLMSAMAAITPKQLPIPPSLNSLSDTLLYTLPSRRICSRSFLSEIKLPKIHNTDVELTILNPKTPMLTWQPGTKELRVRIMMMRTCMHMCVCMYACMNVCMYVCFLTPHRPEPGVIWRPHTFENTGFEIEIGRLR